MTATRVDSGAPSDGEVAGGARGDGSGAADGWVATELELVVRRPSTVVLQVALAGPPGPGEELDLRCDGVPLDAEVVPAAVGGRQHLVHAPAGRLTVRYAAPVPSAAAARAADAAVAPAERIEGLRPSRYCPSDRALGLAAEFAGIAAEAERVAAICEHVAGRTVYTPGSSGPTTDGVDTLLAGEGVCRDYAHAVALLCRAAGVPARVVAVYAPGLSPMDLHAVVEAAVDGTWTVWDATRLAPRPSLLRIATGRDAADTAFVTVLDGRADLERLAVTAVAPGDLPYDDHGGPVTLTLG